MEKCPECKFKKVKSEDIRHPVTEEVVMTRSICKNCGHILRETSYEEEEK